MKYLSPSEMHKPRSRRLRKKLRIGEFKEYCFNLDITFDRTKIAFKIALNSLVEFVETNDWAMLVGVIRIQIIFQVLCVNGMQGR